LKKISGFNPKFISGAISVGNMPGSQSIKIYGLMFCHHLPNKVANQVKMMKELDGNITV